MPHDKFCTYVRFPQYNQVPKTCYISKKNFRHKWSSCSVNKYFKIYTNLALNKIGNILIDVTLRRVHLTTCLGRTIRIIYSDCVFVAFFIQHAKCMRCIILSSVACLAVPYISTLFHSRFSGKNLFNIKCVFWFIYNFCLKNFSF
jgi:hypothetical protein